VKSLNTFGKGGPVRFGARIALPLTPSCATGFPPPNAAMSKAAPMTRIYKILDEAEWSEALRKGEFVGSAIDIADGFIHLSARDQVEETAARHFAGRAGLLLVAFDAVDFGDSLVWEASRGGALFPHVYGVIAPSLARSADALPLGADGRHVFPPFERRE
jgi:uncharacterized protein (DUF952 family)